METYIEDLAYDQKLLNVIGPKLLDEFLPNGSYGWTGLNVGGEDASGRASVATQAPLKAAPGSCPPICRHSRDGRAQQFSHRE